MSHKNVSSVSNKATLKNEGFLSKLSSTLMTRQAPPLQEVETRSTLTWHKTTDVKERIKTATGTIPIYHDTPEEEVQAIREAAAMVPTLEEAKQMEEAEVEAIASNVIAEAASFAVQSFTETTTTSTKIFIAVDDYLPDNDDGLPLLSGQKVELIDSTDERASKKPRIESDEGVQLLDNSAAKYKMSIRPKKNHPNPKARTPEPKEERWLVRDEETGKTGMVPAKLLGAAPAGTLFATSLKRSLQEMSEEESLEVKRKLTKEMKEIKSSKLRKSGSKLLGPSPEEEAMAKRATTIKELIETEEEFVKDLEFVVSNYYSLIDNPSTAKEIKDQKETIFGNFKFISDFHQK